jgi:predicted PurR-regulated permease PerM
LDDYKNVSGGSVRACARLHITRFIGGWAVNSSSSTLNTILISVIVVATLYLARDVLIPIALAWILSFMLEPPVRILKNLGVPCGIRVPRWLAVITVVLLAFAAIFALGGIMARQVTQLAGALPGYQLTAGAKIQKLQALIPFPFELPEPRDYSVQMLNKLMSPLLGTFATSGIVIVFVIFILAQRKELRNRLVRLAGSTDFPRTTEAIDDAADRLSHLFLIQLGINTGFAMLIGLGLWCIGIPSPFLWGGLLQEFFASSPISGRSLAWSSHWRLLFQSIPAGQRFSGQRPCSSVSRS